MARFARMGLAMSATLFTALMPSQLPAQSDQDAVNIYSARKQELIQPLLEDFQARSGIEVNLVTGKADELLTRLELEADATPTDLFITVDAGRLHRAKEAGVLQPIDETGITGAVPEHLQDKDGQWIGLSKRARAIVYAADRVDEGRLSTLRGADPPGVEGQDLHPLVKQHLQSIPRRLDDCRKRD